MSVELDHGPTGGTDVRFSNRPIWVKRFQTIHRYSVDVTHGLVLLFGIGTRAVPSWDSKTRRNNLWGGLTVRRTAGPSGHTNSPHPSSREGHHSTAWWSSMFLLSDVILHSCHAAAASSRVQRNSVPSTQMRCTKDRDRYGRVVAVCLVGGEDINAWMVAKGWAIAYRYYSNDYVRQEEQASKSKIGIWQGEFVPPSDWRRGDHLQKTNSQRSENNLSKAATSDNCVIKGNISKNGKRIYHVPGDEFYSQTIIDVAKGERWFCSEAEAQAAGWRPSRR